MKCEPTMAILPGPGSDLFADEIATLSAPERVAQAITRGLLRREYTVGQRLVEAELTERLNASRSTIRESLKILASRGIVEIVPYKGAVIRDLSLADAENLLDVLEVLTCLAARMAAQKINKPGNESRFKDCVLSLTDGDEDADLENALDKRAKFHQEIFDIADCEDLSRSVPSWRAHLFRIQFYRFYTRSDMKSMMNEYRAISDAIFANDPQKAEIQMRKHFSKTRERIIPHTRSR